MENKYYTPTIEEFYIGFEFESDYVLFRKGVNIRSWNKCILSENELWFWDSYIQDATPTEFRVKCLDREDIESLGWESEKVIIQDDDENDTWSDGFVKYTDDSAWFEFVKISEEHFYIQKKWYRNEVTQMCRTVFYGTVKNKSELKRLMQQLNIQE